MLTVAMIALFAVGFGAARSAARHGLTRQWTAHPDVYPIAAKARAAGNTVYVGSGDGYEYAYDVTSGRLRWRSYLGVTTSVCDGVRLTVGIASTPSVRDGVLYLGGGDARWYALDAGTGRVLWTLTTGDNSVTGGDYNWSSPLLYRGHAYIGVASYCDSPLVQGKLLRVNLASHRVESVWKAVPDGRLGATIWTSPVVDPRAGTIYVTTGNHLGPGERYGESIVALDARTLAIRDHWAVPPRDRVEDSDWGTSPTLFRDMRGRALVAAVNKNGILYAFRRNRLGVGPVWRTRIARGGPCPTCGDGSVSTGLFDGRRLFVAGGATTLHGRSYGGAIRAIDPTTGTTLWAMGLPSPVLGAIAGANGKIVVGRSDGRLDVLGAASGRVLYQNVLAGVGPQRIFAAPAISRGRLFIGTTSGVIYAFRFPRSAGGGGSRPAGGGRGPRAVRAAQDLRGQ